MSPAAAYGNSIVTIEAMVGLLSFAMINGERFMTKRLSVFDVANWLGLLAVAGGHNHMTESESESHAFRFSTQDAAWNGMNFQPMQHLGSTEPPAPLLLLAAILIMMKITRTRARGLIC